MPDPSPLTDTEIAEMRDIAQMAAENEALSQREFDAVCDAFPRLLASLEAERKRVQLAEDQLEAVDAALPDWEPEPGSEVGCVGRVQTILNLLADRAALEAERERADQLADELWAGPRVVRDHLELDPRPHPWRPGSPRSGSREVEVGAPKSWNDYRDWAQANLGCDDQEACRYADERVRRETEQRAGEDGHPTLSATGERETGGDR